MDCNNDKKYQYNSNIDQNQGGDQHLIYLVLTIF
jgi:hypothetical protein